MSTARTIRRARLKDQKRLAQRLHLAVQRKDNVAWDAHVAEALRKGYITAVQEQALKTQRDYVNQALAARPDREQILAGKIAQALRNP